MHCKLNLSRTTFFIAITLIFFAACKPAPSPNPVPTDNDDNGGFASDASRIELVNNDVISLADAAGSLYNGAYMKATHTTLGACALVGHDTDNTLGLHTLTIYFGDKDCKCLDGRNRRGSIIINYYGNYPDSLQPHVITFSNYYVNDNNLTGSITCTRIDTTVVGNWYYQVSVNDTLNMSPDPLNSQWVIWNGTLVRKWIAGYATNDRSDDVFSVSGSANLTRPNGHQFTFNISSALQFALNCDYAESGVVNVNGLAGARILNYGGGNCDALAQITIGAVVNGVNLTK